VQDAFRNPDLPDEVDRETATSDVQVIREWITLRSCHSGVYVNSYVYVQDEYS
jgi:hypothetical protein